MRNRTLRVLITTTTLFFFLVACEGNSEEGGPELSSDQTVPTSESAPGTFDVRDGESTSYASDQMSQAKPTLEVDESVQQKIIHILQRNDVDGLRDLIERGLPIDKPYHEQPLLLWAAQQGYLRMAKLLLEEGANPDIQREDRVTALYLAALYDQPEVMSVLLEYSADPNVQVGDGQQTSEGATALMAAVMVNNAELVTLLLDAGADPTIKRDDGVHAFNMASKEVSDLLSERGASPPVANLSQESNWNSKAEEAVLSMDHAALREALAKGADPNSEAAMWSSLIDAAVSVSVFADDEKAFVEENKTDEIVSILIEYGGQVDPDKPESISALSIASMSGFTSIAQVLLEAGADPDWRPQGRRYSQPTPLWYAALHGYTELVQLLVDHGADLTITHRSTGTMGRPDTVTTPLEIAKEKGHSDVVAILRRAMH